MKILDKIEDGNVECWACGTKLSGAIIQRSSEWGVSILVNPCKKCCSIGITRIVNKTEAVGPELEVKVGM